MFKAFCTEADVFAMVSHSQEFRQVKVMIPLKMLIDIKAVSGTVFEMINAVYPDKPLIVIKAVSGTVFDMISAAYYENPLIFTGAI